MDPLISACSACILEAWQRESSGLGPVRFQWDGLFANVGRANAVSHTRSDIEAQIDGGSPVATLQH